MEVNLSFASVWFPNDFIRLGFPTVLTELHVQYTAISILSPFFHVSDFTRAGFNHNRSFSQFLVP
jgi:hypothetical protein